MFFLKGAFIIKQIMVVSCILLFLAACGSESTQSGNKEGKVQVNSQQKQDDQSSQRKKILQEVGYVVWLDSDRLGLAKKRGDNNINFKVETKKVDQEIKSKLKVGQKVKITYSFMKFSSPPIVTPATLEVLEE